MVSNKTLNFKNTADVLEDVTMFLPHDHNPKYLLIVVDV